MPFSYATLLPCIKRLGEITGFGQVTRPYSLRYGGGKAFNDDGELRVIQYSDHESALTLSTGKVAETMQNLIMGHASIDVFLKHYLSRKVTIDTQAVVRGIPTQDTIMRAACTMSRSIDARRPQRLTLEQSLSVSDHPKIQSLLRQRGNPARRHLTHDDNAKHNDLGRKINQERQRQRNKLLRKIKKHWEFE